MASALYNNVKLPDIIEQWLAPVFSYYNPEECLYMSYKDGLDDSR